MEQQNIDSSWAAWSNHVLRELERLDLCGKEIKVTIAEMEKHSSAATEAKIADVKKELVALNEKILLISVDISALKVKAGAWGAIGAVLILLLNFLLRNVLNNPG